MKQMARLISDMIENTAKTLADKLSTETITVTDAYGRTQEIIVDGHPYQPKRIESLDIISKPICNHKYHRKGWQKGYCKLCGNQKELKQ